MWDEIMMLMPCIKKYGLVKMCVKTRQERNVRGASCRNSGPISLNVGSASISGSSAWLSNQEIAEVGSSLNNTMTTTHYTIKFTAVWPLMAKFVRAHPIEPWIRLCIAKIKYFPNQFDCPSAAETSKFVNMREEIFLCLWGVQKSSFGLTTCACFLAEVQLTSTIRTWLW